MAKWEQLIAARDRKHLSQMEAAERVNVGLVNHQRWERGKRKPQPHHMRSLCEIFGTQLVYHENASCSEESSSRDCEVASTSVPPTSDLVVVEKIPVPQTEENNELPSLLTAYMTAHLWSLVLRDHPTCNEKRCAIRQAIEEFDSMNANNKNYQITRREAICTLATLPIITFGLTLPGKEIAPAQYGSVLAQGAASLEACWELYKSGNASELLLGFRCASKYLATLQTIGQTSALHQKDALHLATQYALLKTLLGWHCAGSTATIQYAKEAVALSKETGDISLQLSACSKLAWAYFYEKKYNRALASAQEAEMILERSCRNLDGEPVHSCIYGGTYSTLALMQATCRQSPDGALGKVIDSDPGDESYAFMDFKRSNLPLEVGWTYSYQGNQLKSMEWLAKRVDPETLACKIPQSEVGRVATINTMALSSLKAKDRDLEKTIHFWVAGIEGAKSLKSEQRFTDAVATYELMEVAWPGEKRITDLRDHIVHWEE